ncbi:MAG: MATE family efflux transporter [Oscillospiraceae bacterium]|nr:MATE family efflux transporter [Oscillospiraceae bacterium]
MTLNHYFGDRRFYRTALSVALPIMIQNGITNFVGMLDNIMVGRVGTVEMTGVSIANTLLFVFNLAVFGAISGAGIFGAQFYGKGDHEGVRFAFRFKLLECAALLALGVGVYLLLGEKLMLLYLRGEGAQTNIQESLRFGQSYLRIMLLGLPPFALAQCYAGTLRETGKTVPPMAAGLIAVGVNFVCNWLLIFGKLGLPRLGSDGAAIATVISRYVEAAVIMLWTHRRADGNPFIRGAWRSFRIPGRLAGHILRRGTPLILNETLWALGQALLLQSYSIRSYDVVSATNIAFTLGNVFNVAFIAMGAAIGILVGQQLGAGQIEAAKATDRRLIVFTELICLVFGSAMAALSGVFPRIYNTEPEIRALASRFILINAALMPVHAYANAAYFTLRSGGKTFVTFLFDSVFSCVIVAPTAYLLSRYTEIPIVWLFLCCESLDLVKCTVGFFMIRSGVWIQNIVKEEY